MQKLDILIRSTPDKLNEWDYPELPSIRKNSCELFEIQSFTIETWNRLKKWLQDVHGMTEQNILSMKRAEVLALLKNAVVEKINREQMGIDLQSIKDKIKQSEKYRLLHFREKKVLDEILSNGPIIGKKITNATGVSQNNLTDVIIPKLKLEFGVENQGGGRGYIIPEATLRKMSAKLG